MDEPFDYGGRFFRLGESIRSVVPGRACWAGYGRTYAKHRLPGTREGRVLGYSRFLPSLRLGFE